MGLADLAAWQWSGYPLYHQSRANLILHIVAVPLFLLGNIAVLSALFVLSWRLAVVGLAVSAVAFGVQGLGHKGEPVPSVPFKGLGNAVGRIFLEQWMTFPRFVLSGQWQENLRRSARPAGGRR